MKKLLAFCMATLLVGCSAAPSSSVSSSSVTSDSSAAVSTPESSSSASESSASSNAGIEVEKDFGSVTITAPASMYADDLDADTLAKEMDFDSVTIKGDSVVLVMSKKRHNKLLSDLREQLQNQFKGIATDTQSPYIKNIDVNSDFTKVTVLVEKTAYEAAFDMTPFLIESLINLYHIYSGEDAAKHLQILDETSKELLYEETF